MTAASVLAACGASRGLLARATPERWQRINYRGQQVSLDGGLAAALGAQAGLAMLLTRRPRLALAGLIATGAGACAGWIDDHHEADFSAAGKGLAGHLGALRRGQLTSGTVKIGLIGAGAITAAGILSGGIHKSLGDTVVRAVAIAGTANLVNLLDLRPGRALKTTAGLTALAATSSSGRPLAAISGAVAAAVAPEDLEGRTMLGDLGANALGALTGTALAAHGSATVRLAAAGGSTALILASERISFSRVIDSHPVLRRVDEWGR